MMPSLKTVYWFHGHTCPMSTLGFRAGQLAKKLLKLKRTDYRVAVAKLFYKSCAIDGVQISFPATYGNGNLVVYDEKEMKFEFIRTDVQKSVILTFSETLYAVMNEYLASRKAFEDNKTNKLKSMMKEKYNNFLKFTQKAEAEEIFIVRHNNG